MTSDTTVIRTDDMVLATLLIMEEFEYRHEIVVSGRERGVDCQWVFDVNPEDADEADLIVLNFNKRQNRVEPRSFASAWAATRRDMFDFMSNRLPD